MKKTSSLRSLGRFLLAGVGRQTGLQLQTCRHDRLTSRLRAALVVSALATLALCDRSFAQVSLPSAPPYQTISATGHSRSVAIGDMNGDGNQDVVIGLLQSQNIQIVLGDGQGGFGTPVQSPAFPSSLAARPLGIVLGDVNGDGKLDVVAFDIDNSGALSVLLGNGAGSLGSPTVLNFFDTRNPSDTRYHVYSATLADVNRDGKPDLIVGAANSFFTSKGDVWVQLNDGFGNFSAPATTTIVWTRFMGHGETPAQFVAAGDLDGDASGDIVVTSTFGQFGSGNAVTVLYGNGTGAFSPTVGLPFPNTPNGRANQAQGVVIADMDGAGFPDLVVPASDFGSTGAGAVTVFRSTGSRAFNAGTTYATPQFRTGMAAVGDLNNDGHRDVVVTGALNGGSLDYLLNDGAGGLGTPTFIPGLLARGLALGDLTRSGPGTLDIVVGTTDAGTKLLLNGPAGAPPCEQQLAAAQQQIQLLQGQISTLSASVTLLQNQLAAANATIANRDQAIQSLTIQNGLLQNQVTTLNSQLTAANNQVAALTAANAQLQSDLAAANQANQDQQNQIAQLQTQVSALLQQNQALQSQAGELTSQVNALTLENQTLQSELDALKSPGSQVAAVLQSVQGLLPGASKDARGKLEQAIKKLGDAQVFLAAGDLDHALQSIKPALQELINAADKGSNTAALQRTLVEAVALRVARAVDDVEAIAGSNHKKVQEAKALLQQGQTLLTQGKFKEALDSFLGALQKASEARS